MNYTEKMQKMLKKRGKKKYKEKSVPDEAKVFKKWNKGMNKIRVPEEKMKE